MTQAIIQTNLDELLADCGTIDAVSWQAPKQMTYAQWAEIGSRFQKVNSSINWWLGDWINIGERKWGEKYTQALDATGNKLQTLMNYSYVSRNVPFSVRTEKLSWTHHWHVADLEEDAQRQLLRFAEEHDLSSRELLEAVRDYKANINQLSSINEPPVIEQSHANGTNGLHSQDNQGTACDEPPYMDNSLYVDHENDADEEHEYREKHFTVIDEHGIEEHVTVKPDEELVVVNKPHVAQNSGNNEWYTPSEYIDAARLVMGGIDLDPASNPIANETVKASTYYTVDDNGLDQQWTGRVWMNPPYAKGLIDRFSSKLRDHYIQNDIKEAIVLVNNATETEWFQDLISVASAVVFPRSRVRFYRPDGKLGDPLQGQAVIYIGQNTQLFRDAFSKFGWSATL